MSENVVEALGTFRYYNTLHGFQHCNSDDDRSFIVAMLPENVNSVKVKQRLETETGVTGLVFDDFIGHDYFSVPEDQRDRIPTVINAFLAMLEVKKLPEPPVRPANVHGSLEYQGTFVGGFDVILSDAGSSIYPLSVTPEGHVFSCQPFHPYIRLQTRLLPRYAGGSTFSLEASERAFIKSINEVYQSICSVNPACRFEDMYGHIWVHAREELWKTVEGKALARRLMRTHKWSADRLATGPSDFRPDGAIRKRVMTNPELLENPSMDFPLCVVAAAAAPPSPPVDASPAVDECMVCMDRAADTLVLPCEHCVVCRECSNQLTTTRDARTCLRCRRDITGILWDNQE